MICCSRRQQQVKKRQTFHFEAELYQIGMFEYPPTGLVPVRKSVMMRTVKVIALMQIMRKTTRNPREWFFVAFKKRQLTAGSAFEGWLF